MPSGGQIGSGVKIAYALSSPHTWIAIPAIRDISQLPFIERDQVEVTTHGVTSLRQFIPGLGQVQDFEFTVLANLDANSVHTALRELERTQDIVWFRCEIPNDSNLATTQYMAYEFQGRVSKFGLTTPIDGAKEATITVLYNDNHMVQKTMASQF